eukprot:TRINITY_DN476_c0_g1_i1.p1 TRINITY_DN476_c0_g1~~TRINITY_DN476_c0_g1_i1.p1  ORF type:complete len:488 (-),score=16.00 TRINITY_DN476_c0_g1_i1:862-2325(-)
MCWQRFFQVAVAISYHLVTLTGLQIGPFTNIDDNCFGEVAFSKVVNAEDAEGVVPYLVSLQIENLRDTNYFEHFCAGTVIQDRVVLTAAHCVWEQTNDFIKDYRVNHTGTSGLFSQKVSVALGQYCRHMGKERYKVDKFYLPPNYTGNVMDGNDIALLLLEDKFTYSAGDPFVNIAESSQEFLQNFTIYGWGRMEQGEDNPTIFRTSVRPLQVAPQNLLPITDCVQKISNHYHSNYWVNMDQSQWLCGTYTDFSRANLTVDACVGDSGGPLLMATSDSSLPTVQVGVTSWGPEQSCQGVDGLPGVYTRIDTHLGWINQVIAEIESEIREDSEEIKSNLVNSTTPIAVSTPVQSPSSTPESSPVLISTPQMQSPSEASEPIPISITTPSPQPTPSTPSASPTPSPSTPSTIPSPEPTSTPSPNPSTATESLRPCPRSQCFGSVRSCCWQSMSNTCSVGFFRTYTYDGQCAGGKAVWKHSRLASYNCYC